MAKKKPVPKKAKTNGAMTEIKQLHACIAKDQAELAKLYKKSAAESNTNLGALKKSLAKAKKTHVRVTKDKKKLPKDYTSSVSLLGSLKMDFATEQAILAALKVENKKLTAPPQDTSIMLPHQLVNQISSLIEAAKEKLAPRVYSDVWKGSVGYVDAVTANGKWIIEYYDNTSEIVGKERLIQVREGHDNMSWKKGKQSARREGAGPRAGRYVGRQVRRHFEGHGWYTGKVIKNNKEDEQHEVKYTDGEIYHLSEKKVKNILLYENDSST